MAKKTQPRFTIGSYVHCTQRCWFVSNNGKRRPYRVSCNLYGWVVGAVRRYEGNIFSDTDYQGDHYTYLRAGKSYFLWKVASSLTSRPIEVLDADICDADTPVGTADTILTFKAPLYPKSTYSMSDMEKHELSVIMRDHPRDNKGRWKKL